MTKFNKINKRQPTNMNKEYIWSLLTFMMYIQSYIVEIELSIQVYSFSIAIQYDIRE